MTKARRNRYGWLVGAVVTAFGAGGIGYYFGAFSGGTGRLDPGDAALVALGKRLYAETCASCHGDRLQGQANWKRPLPEGGFPAPPHDASGHTWHHPDDLLIQITKYGGASVVPRGHKSNMPAFGGTLTDREIRAVLSYIKSHWPREIRSRHDQINAMADR